MTATRSLSLIVFFAVSSTQGVAQGRIHTLRGNAAGDQFGSSVSAAGDIDEDGFADVIIGAPFAEQSGRAYVYSGKDGSLLRTFKGANPGDLFGVGVSYMADANGDDVVELVIGAAQTVTTKLGYVQVYSGKDGALMHTVQGTRPFEQLGAYVANVGDVDGDKIPDFAAGAPAFVGEVVFSLGSVLVCSGKDGSIIYDWRGDDRGGFGYYVRCGGDIDGDGVLDILTGAPFDSTTKIRAGMARVYSGVDGSVIHTLYGENEFDHFGVSVGRVGDLDQDGLDDFLVGSYGSDAGGPDHGAVWVYSGKDASVIHEFHGDSQEEDFGFVLSGLEDVNGDEFRDILIGARFDDQAGFTSGSARMYSGLTGNLLYEVFGTSAEDQLGRATKYAGDVNGDGFGDAVIGAYFSNDTGLHSTLR